MDNKHLANLGLVLIASLATLGGLLILLNVSVSADTPTAPVNDPQPLATPAHVIPDLYNLPPGETVIITSTFVAQSPGYLVGTYEHFERNRPLLPYSYVRLTNDVPDPDEDGAVLAVTGEIYTYTHDYAYLGEQEGRGISVTTWSVVVPAPVGAATNQPATGPESTGDLTPQQDADGDEDCACKWAFIVSGGVNEDSNHPRYWNDVVQKWEYKNEHADYPEECITTFYHEGTGESDDVPAGRVVTATQENIETALAALAPKMQACKERGIKPTLQFLVTDHGTGYHGANQGAGSDREGLGGRVDTDGDEGGDSDGIPERELRVDGSELAEGRGYLMDLYDNDGGQDPDTVVGKLGGVVKVWRCITPTCSMSGFPAGWQEVAADSNGDGVIDSSDGGIDLNGDGDTGDEVSFDEGINLLNDHVLTDDDLTDALQPLCPSGVDLYVEMAQCFGGGFQDDLARLRAHGCHVHFAAAASEDEYSWGSSGEDGYDYFEKHFIDKITEILTSTGTTTVTPETWREAHEHAAGQPESQRHNTNPTSDIDCLIMFGPYIENGQVCLRVTNYCTAAVEADVHLSSYNWSIGTTPLDEKNGTLTLEPGETKTWCWPLPEETGTYCFLGYAATNEPRREFHPRWLNDQEITAPESNEPVQRTFLVDGNYVENGIVYTYPLVILEPVTALPEGWNYRLDPPWVNEGLWVEDGPVPVTVTLVPTAEIMGIGGVWLHGWGVDISGGLGPMAMPPKDRYLGNVYLELDTRTRVYLPLVMRGN